MDQYTKSVVTQGSRTGKDRCTNKATLSEYFCAGNMISSKSIQCPTGCEDGRCLGCQDTDGGDFPEVYGVVTIGSELTKKDICSNQGDGNDLREFFCISHEELSSRTVTCPGGCDGGRCL